MDVKSRVITKIDELLSEYNEEKEGLGPIMKGKRSIDNFYRVSGAIIALNTLKQQIEKSIDSYTSVSDFMGKVELQITVTHQRLPYSKYSSGTYLNAEPGIIEAFNLIRKYLLHLETEFEG